MMDKKRVMLTGAVSALSMIAAQRHKKIEKPEQYILINSLDDLSEEEKGWINKAGLTIVLTGSPEAEKLLGEAGLTEEETLASKEHIQELEYFDKTLQSIPEFINGKEKPTCKKHHEYIDGKCRFCNRPMNA